MYYIITKLINYSPSQNLNSLIWHAMHTLIIKALHFVTDVQPLKYFFSETNELYSITIVLLGWFLSIHAFLLRPCPWIDISKCSELAQLNLQVQYYINVMYSLGVTHTHTLTQHNAGKEHNFYKSDTCQLQASMCLA